MVKRIFKIAIPASILTCLILFIFVKATDSSSVDDYMRNKYNRHDAVTVIANDVDYDSLNKVCDSLRERGIEAFVAMQNYDGDVTDISAEYGCPDNDCLLITCLGKTASLSAYGSYKGVYTPEVCEQIMSTAQPFSGDKAKWLKQMSYSIINEWPGAIKSSLSYEFFSNLFTGIVVAFTMAGVIVVSEKEEFKNERDS